MTVSKMMGGLTALLVGFGSIAAHAQTSNPGGPCYEAKDTEPGSEALGYFRIAIGNVGQLVSPAEKGRGDPNATAYIVSGVYNPNIDGGAAPRSVSGSIQLQTGQGAQMGLFVYQAASQRPFSMQCRAGRPSLTPGKWGCIVANADLSVGNVELTKVDPLLQPECQADFRP